MNNAVFFIDNKDFFKDKIIFQLADNQSVVSFLSAVFKAFLIKSSVFKKAFDSLFSLGVDLKINQKINSKSTLNKAFLIFNLLFFILIPPSVFGQKNAKNTFKKDVKTVMPFNGNWSGKGTVDYGFGSRTEFEYELILEQKKDGTITGVSVTFLHIDGKRYSAKALVEGKVVKTYLNCAEKYNITEDKLPNSGWIPFVKMELILKNDGTTLEGIYECSDKSNGRIILKRKIPQV